VSDNRNFLQLIAGIFDGSFRHRTEKEIKEEQNPHKYWMDEPSVFPGISDYIHVDSFNPYKYPVLKEVTVPIIYNGASGSSYQAPEPLDVSDAWIDRIWQKMYAKPVIVRCSHCNSHNIISNPTCIQCGAPMGDYKRMVSYE
jgi:hypothetical protein